MEHFRAVHSKLTRPALIGALLCAGAFATPAFAADQTHDCLSNPGGAETADFVFHPRLMGVDGSEGDGDVFTDDFEHYFAYWIEVHEYDPTRPNWTGPQVCRVEGRWGKNWDIPNIRPEFVTVDPGGVVYLENVPRHSKLHMQFWAREDDSGDDDRLDFDPSPTGEFVAIDLFVDEMKAQTMVGAREGRFDLGLNKAKRLVGDGSIGVPGDKVRGFLEFVVNMHPATWASGIGPISPNLPSPGQALGGATIVAPGTLKIATEPLCRDYALKAVDFNVEAQNLGCGFSGAKWSNDHQMHFDWCMKGDNSKLAGSSNVQRAADLQTCAAQKGTQPAPNLAVCAIYATEATATATQAGQLGCGFTGPRWSADYGGHFAWCMAGANPAVMVTETASRASQLVGCIAAKGN